MTQIATEETVLSHILSQFKIDGTAVAVSAHGSGHIHDTYHVQNGKTGKPDYLLQRINHHVFKNVPALMENIAKVSAHLRRKLEATPEAQPEKEVLTLVPTQEGGWYHQDASGNYWRMYLFLNGTSSYDLVTTVQQAFEGGKAFGKFQALLADLPVGELHDTIPDFHNVVNRLRLFREAVVANPVNRVEQVGPEIAFVEERAHDMSAIYRMGRRGELPLRITHNDTKFNNVLLDQKGKAQCVIDLDTVMPGYVAYDFGDAIRTTVNTAPEDEPELEKIQVDLALFEGFAEGFLRETYRSLSEQEVASLLHGVLLLPFIMGLRFLTDYLDGDHYYKTYFKEHNLQRARAQFQLVRQLEACQPELHLIMERVLEKAREAEVETQL